MFFSKRSEIPSLSAQECLDLLKANPDVQLLDVRLPREYSEASIPGSIHLELAEILAGKWVCLLPYKDQGLILQCRSGERSMKAAQYLSKQGFTKLWNMAGGILAYQKLP